MQFTTKAFFAAALLASSAFALPNEAAPGERQAYYKGTRRFRKGTRPCIASAPVSTPPAAPQVAAAAAPVPTPEALLAPPPPPPPPKVEDVVVVVTTSEAPKPTQAPPPPPPPPPAPVSTPEPTPTPAPAAKVPVVAAAPAANQASSPQAASAAASTPVSSSSGLSSDEQAALDQHNSARAAQGLQPLTYDTKLASDAKAWAQNLSSIGSMQHSSGDQRSGQGENLYWQSHEKTPNTNAAASWASESSQYNGQPVGQGDFAAYGHYTQMIWKSTSKVGFGTASDGKGGMYVVARYNPAGNMIGQTPTQ